MENIDTSLPLERSGDDDVEAAHNIEEQIDKVLEEEIGARHVIQSQGTSIMQVIIFQWLSSHITFSFFDR